MNIPPPTSEFGATTKPKLLNLVVRLLRQRERIIEPEWPERRIPDQTHSDRGANMHCVIDRALHGVGDARAPGGARVSREHLARCRECGRTDIVPKRTGIGEGS